MRYEILKSIQNKLKEADVEAKLFEPNWDRPQQFPVVWIELDDEELKEGVNTQERRIPFSVFAATRTTYDDRDKAQEDLLMLADIIEATLSDYITMIDSKKLIVEYRGFSYFSEAAIQEGKAFVIVAVAVKFRVRYRR